MCHTNKRAILYVGVHEDPVYIYGFTYVIAHFIVFPNVRKINNPQPENYLY